MATNEIVDDTFGKWFLDEEGDDEINPDRERKFKEPQEQALEEGLVEFANWEDKFKREMKENVGVTDDNIIARSFEAVKKAAMATCMVAREDGGGGTGFLLKFNTSRGYLVITANHVIKNDDQAKISKVIFDYNKKDFSSEGARGFKVDEILAFSLRTTGPEDRENLDYSVLTLQYKPEDEEFLEERAHIFVDESARVQATGNKDIAKYWQYPKRPLIMFSHPRGLAKRMSIGPFPEITDYPVSHSKHTLPSLKGSSGSNIIFSPVDDNSWTDWRSGFLHYRKWSEKECKLAIGWQAIGDHLREMASQKWGP